MAGTITHKWEGTTLVVTSDSGTTSCDLKGKQGDMGVRGAQGAKGEPYFTYDDLTPEQKEELRGDIQTDRDTVINTSYSNALKGNAKGAAIALDDVSPLEHKIQVKARSKNLLSYPFGEGSKTVNGMTYTVSEDGYVHATGTPTGGANYYFKYQGQYSLPSGTYTASLVGDDLPKNAILWLFNLAENKMVAMLGTKRVQTFTLEQEMSFGVYLYLSTDAVVNGDFTFSVQIEKGTTATTYTPYVTDNTEVTVKSCGKNLIPYPYETKTTTISGITFTDNGDGTITLRGTATEAIIFTPITSTSAFYINSGTYTFGSNIVGDFNGIYLQGKLIEDDSVSAAPIEKKAITFTITDSMHFRFNIRIAAGTNCDNVVIKPQLEYSTIATDYEPYIEGEEITTTLAEGAELTSIAPNMTISTNKDGVTIECDYNKDINIAYQKLVNTIISLGGNI